MSVIVTAEKAVQKKNPQPKPAKAPKEKEPEKESK